MASSSTICRQITSEDIQAWLLEQSDERGWTPATRNRYRDAFSLVFRKAVENHVLTVNPATLVKAKPEHNERVRFLSATEETRLSAALHKDWAQHVPAFLVSIHTGMRAGEQFQLKWRDVSLERRLISLPKTKSGKARHIPLNAIACSALQGTETGTTGTGGQTERRRERITPSKRMCSGMRAATRSTITGGGLTTH